MRKVFLENLPTKEGIGANKNKQVIDWKVSADNKVKFVYDKIKGEFEIIDYNAKTRKLNLIYLNNDFQILSDGLKNCKITKILKLRTLEYKYNIEDIIENKVSKIKIIEQIRIKNKNGSMSRGYKYQCLKCGNTDKISESHLVEGKGCNICCASSQKVVKGINDIATTNPELVKYFVDINDTYINSIGSNKKVNVICNECGNIKKMQICNLYNQGFSCPKCGDGISYPEKILFNLLDQLNLKFKHNIPLAWSNNKQYDFYISSINGIIETHGLQHYQESFSYCGGRLLQEEQENDKVKQDLALKNGIENYIVIDCRKSDLEFIKNNIINSELSNLFDLSKINWLKCHEYACSSLVKVICDLWNNGTESAVKIGDIIGLNRNTICRYLKQGKLLNWCNYKTNHEMKKDFIIKACDLWNNEIKNPIEIANLLNVNSDSARNYLKEGAKLKLCDYTPEKSVYISDTKKSKSVICLENGMVFQSSREIEEKSLKLFKLKLDRNNIRSACNGHLKSYKGYHFKYVENNDKDMVS